jgi:hypothetical protein
VADSGVLLRLGTESLESCGTGLEVSRESDEGSVLVSRGEGAVLPSVLVRRVI